MITPPTEPKAGGLAATTDDAYSEASLRPLFENILFSMGIIELDEDDDITFIRINPSQARFMRLPAEQIEGRRLSAFTSPEVLALWRSMCQEAQARGTMVSTEFVGSRFHPGFYWHSIAHLGETAAGRPRFGFVTMDISERKRLEAQVTRQNEELSLEIEERRRTQEILRKKQDEILALSTPLLKVWDGVLALPVIGVVDSERAGHIMTKLLHEISREQIRVAILDLTGVEEVDAETADHLLRIARAASLLGSRCVLSGISPRIAQTMIASGLRAEGFATFGTLKDALTDALPRRTGDKD